MAIYTIRTTSVQDWRDSMMSKAEFNAMAAETRRNNAGSGAINFGKGSSTAALNVNEGIHTSTTIPNSMYLGKVSGTGTSATDAYIASINGSIVAAKYLNTTTADAALLLPPTPTVLPSTATSTQQQIDSGVIKHADASNSGLIVNGKFDTDTSGWTALGCTLSIVNGMIRVLNTGANGYAVQGIPTVAGKKYYLEYESLDATAASTYVQVVSDTNTQLVVGTTTPKSMIEFTAITSLTNVRLMSFGATGTYIDYDNIAVFPADAISRSDLCFIESFHEDVSEKDFVYPLGNVQYLGTTGDSGTPVAGAFAGAATYSLFSDTWQADGALVGKGYVWSTLSDANKKAFVANPENNCYLDGDKVIQVRYRMRVVMGWGDSWATPLNVFAWVGYSSTLSTQIKAKGKQVSSADYLISSYSEGGYVGGVTITKDILLIGSDYGIYGASNNGLLATQSAYEGKCYALPIALVHRRNQGGYNLTYNPHGTKTMTMTPTSIADCFTEANYTATTGYIGTSTSRPDGLFYDQVSVEDFKPSNKGADLRNTSKKLTAHQIIQEFAPKAIAGTIPYFNNDTTALTTYKDDMEVRDTSGNRYGMVSKVGNVVTIGSSVANKKGFTVVTANGKQYLQVADDATSDATVQMNLSTIKYDIGVFDA